MSEKKSQKKTTAASPASASGSPMDVGLLQQIVKLMAANDLSTVDVRDGNRRIILQRGAQTVVVPASSGAPVLAASPAIAPAHAQAPAAPPPEDANLKPIASPMVGTYYARPSPDAKPFVSVGTAVDEDTDVCIIEAMKVFNSIKAETRGTIAKILVENGQAVEFGQTLFLVKSNE